MSMLEIRNFGRDLDTSREAEAHELCQAFHETTKLGPYRIVRQAIRSIRQATSDDAALRNSHNQKHYPERDRLGSVDNQRAATSIAQRCQLAA